MFLLGQRYSAIKATPRQTLGGKRQLVIKLQLMTEKTLDLTSLGLNDLPKPPYNKTVAVTGTSCRDRGGGGQAGGGAVGGASSPTSPSCRRRCWGETAPAGHRVTRDAPPNRWRREAGSCFFRLGAGRKTIGRARVALASHNWLLLMNGGQLTSVTWPVTWGHPSKPSCYSGLKKHHLTRQRFVSHAVWQLTIYSFTPGKQLKHAAYVFIQSTTKS